MSVDKKHLIKILRDNDVIVSKGKVQLYDLVTEILELTNPKAYMKKFANYRVVYVDGEKYISIDDCIDILKKSRTVKCKNIWRRISKDGDGLSKLEMMQLFASFFESAGIICNYGYVFTNENDEKEYIDFYLPELNWAIEIDDEYRTNNDVVRDLQKQIRFTGLKKCDFTRVNTVDSMHSIVKLIGRITRRAC
jgi:hypothetical protein